MSPIARTTSRRATAMKAVKKIKILNESKASRRQHQRDTKRTRIEKHSVVPFGTRFANTQNQKELQAETKDLSQANRKQTKAHARNANDKGTVEIDGCHLDARQSEEERITREREREAYYKRRVARMVHSDKPMRFSWRTCHNMTKKKHPGSPVQSPIKAINLKSAFKYSQVISIHRLTRDAETILQLTNVGSEEI